MSTAEFGIPLHADAVQAFGQVPVDFTASGLAAMTVSGHKIGGPYGIGALLLGREYTPVPVLHGGGQERHVRSGTLDVPAIASFAVAGRLAAEQREWFAREIGALRDDLVDAVRAAVPDAILGGDPATGSAARQRALHVPGLRGRLPPLLLDAQGIECSTGSACTAGVAQPSHVLLATGTDRPGPRHPALLPRSHLHGGGRRGGGQGDRPGGGAGTDGRPDLTRRRPPARSDRR